MADKVKDSHDVVRYIDSVLRAHKQAGLTIEAKHFYMVRDMLVGPPAEPPAPLSMVDHDFQADMVRRVLRSK